MQDHEAETVLLCAQWLKPGDVAWVDAAAATRGQPYAERLRWVRLRRGAEDATEGKL